MAVGIAVPARLRALDEIAGIQVNFCRMPTCLNFGKPPGPIKRGRGGGAVNPYRRNGLKKGVSGLQCKSCGHISPIKSNLGVAEELARISAYLDPPPGPACPRPDCGNHDRPISAHPELYQRQGKTEIGSQRYLCHGCGRRFSVAAKSTHRQRRTDRNEPLFMDFVNAGVINRICETKHVSPPTIYDKLDFFHRQCLAFAGAQERRIPQLALKRLYLSSDRQDYLVNWRSRKDRTATQLGAIATADNRSRFVFALNLDFDGSLSRDGVEADAKAKGDLTKPPAERRYARLWLQDDYDKAPKEERAGVEATARTLEKHIESAYAKAVQRDDIEALPVEPDRKLPDKGVQVRAEYVMYAHFQLLRRLIGHTEKFRIYADQDSAIRGACLSAFYEEISQKRCDVFYVAIAKRVGRDTKEALVGKAWAEFDQRLADLAAQIQAGAKLDQIDQTMLEAHWEFDLVPVTEQAIFAAIEHRRELRKRRRRGERRDPDELKVEAFVRRLMIKSAIPLMKPKKPWGDRWLTHPLPSLSEPKKMVAHLTDQGHLHEEQRAHLYHRASLHGIDQFFNLLRRRINMAERSLVSATSGREFHIYQPYNPNVLAKLIEILRVYYNYVLVGRQANDAGDASRINGKAGHHRRNSGVSAINLSARRYDAEIAMKRHAITLGALTFAAICSAGSSLQAQKAVSLKPDLAFHFNCEGSSYPPSDTAIEDFLRSRGFNVLNKVRLAKKHHVDFPFNLFIVGIDDQHRMIELESTRGEFFTVALNTPPPTRHAADLEDAVLKFVSDRLGCRVRQISRGENGDDARDFYEEIFRIRRGWFRQADDMERPPA